MSHRKKIVSVQLPALIAGMFLAFNVPADGTSSRGPAAFSDFDLDNNGQVSEEEFNTVRAERRAARAAEGRKMRAASTAPSFADIDTDGDGQINPDELRTAQKAHMAERHKMAEGQGKGYDKGHGHGQGHGAMAKSTGKPCGGMKGNMPAFSDFDLDGNGKIDVAEFNKAHAERISKMAAEGKMMKHAGEAPGFSGIDSNGDGEISPEEFTHHQAQHQQKMHQTKMPEKSVENDSSS